MEGLGGQAGHKEKFDFELLSDWDEDRIVHRPER